MARPKKIKEGYHASIKILGKFYEADGATPSEAIANLEPFGKISGVTVLTITHGDKKQERILPRHATQRLFSSSPLMRELFLKSTSERFAL